MTVPPRFQPVRLGSRRQVLSLLPGALCDAALWRHQIAGLADLADVRVGDLTRDDSIAAMAARVLAALPPRFALAGISLGGYVALEIMRRAPERVTRLALLDVSARPEPSLGGRGGSIPEQEAGDNDALRSSTAATPLMLLLVHPMRLGDRRLATILSAMAGRVGRKAFLRQQRAILRRPDSRPDLAAIRCPTLLLCGRQDPLAPPLLQEEMADAIEGASSVVVEDCGHLPPLECPEIVTEALREWLVS